MGGGRDPETIHCVERRLKTCGHINLLGYSNVMNGFFVSLARVHHTHTQTHTMNRANQWKIVVQSTESQGCLAAESEVLDTQSATRALVRQLRPGNKERRQGGPHPRDPEGQPQGQDHSGTLGLSVGLQGLPPLTIPLQPQACRPIY